ncbi:MAG TPA: copper chaperone [Flavobacteriaceae bacterium]|nr:copper chaperone [Flavobacteriaceae bacterium]
MKYLKLILFLFILLTINYSCKESTKSKENDIAKKSNQVAKYQKVELQIKGMTCEIGCAKLIESKLSKTKGVKFSKVSFKDSLGLVEFDTNILTTKDINKVVENIADGTLYQVSSTQIVKEFTYKK